MAIEKIKAQVISGVWQGIAQSGVDMSCLPQSSQETLVRSIADKVMVAMDVVLSESIDEPPTTQSGKSVVDENATDEHGEKILWKARPFMSLTEEYVLTNERLKIIRGLLSRRVENYELVRIQDIDFKQNLGERVLNLGDITIRGHDPSNPQIVLRDIPVPEEVYEILRHAWMDARKRHGLQFREQM